MTMIDNEILKKIKYIEINTQRLLQGTYIGDYRSKEKGYGLEFDQIRDYELGDDVRFIDWNSSARMNKLLVKQYMHEYNKTIFIGLDISLSTLYGSGTQLKHSVLVALATALALAGQYSRSHVGLMLFADRVYDFIPAKMGKNHVHAIIQKMWSRSAQGTTNIAVALKSLAQLKRKKAIIFLLSDFIDHHTYERELRFLSKRNDVIAIRCLDKTEKTLKLGGMIHVVDSETGQEMLLDGKSDAYSSPNSFLKRRLVQQNNEFQKNHIDYLDIDPSKEYLEPLISFFAHRMMYRVRGL